MADMWIMVALSLLFCWPLANAVHEGSHLLMGKLVNGLEPTGFYPYPHFHQSHFYFARYVAKGKWPYGPGQLIHIAPLISDMVMLTVGLIYVGIHGSLFSIVFSGVFAVDALVWCYGFLWGGTHTDGYRYRYGIRQYLPEPQGPKKTVQKVS